MDDGVDIQVEDDGGGPQFFDNRELPADQANPTPHKVVDTFSQGKLTT